VNTSRTKMGTKTLYITSLLIGGCLTYPQTPIKDGTTSDGCIVNTVTGEKKMVGDSWKVGCNTCLCGTSGIAACTKRFCFKEEEDYGCWDKDHQYRDDGDTWTVGDDSTIICSCTSGHIKCGEQDNKFKNKENDNLGCGVDEFISPRVPGDLWDEDSYKCRCLPSNEKSCTKDPSQTETKETDCEDTEGQKRIDGETWTLPDGFNNCTCSKGFPICSRLIVVSDIKNTEQNLCGVDREEGDSWDVDCNTCTCISKSQGPACTEKACISVDTCTDTYGNIREGGESWKEECNTCRCRKGKKGCTKVLCQVEKNINLVSVPTEDEEQNLCGNGRGKGDSWAVDCNTCTCVSPSIEPICTIKACLSIDSCTDKYGNNRESGESWKEECNTCRCRKGKKGCTKILCEVAKNTNQVFETTENEETSNISDTGCKDTEGHNRLEGESWTLPGILKNSCTCKNGLPICLRGIGATHVNSSEINHCGVDREEGDSWDVDCNTCTCISKSQGPACTEKACISVDTCTDKYGNSREGGESWKEECNTCRCRKGKKGCTKVLCQVEKNINQVSVPTGNEEQSRDICTDKYGDNREFEETWKEECNTCGCGNNGRKWCTKALCQVGVDEEPVFLLEVNESRYVQNTTQCTQDGVINCKSAQVDKDLLMSIQEGDLVHLMKGSNIKMRVSTISVTSSSRSVSFQLGNGGDATVTSSLTSSSVFASIHPNDDSGIIFVIESCGNNCNVIYQRDPDFFNNQEDR